MEREELLHQNYKELIDFLFSRRRLGIKWGLENIQHLVEELNHPERSFPSIHVAGTNGKGSSCVMLESIYRAAGYKTGLYTSPHLIDVCERIRVDGQKIPVNELAGIVEKLTPVIEQQGCSFFEILTAAAFDYFRKEKVDIAIVETGLGGRLDATNVIKPEAALITELDLDHMKTLGNSVVAIAREKAGIVKRGVPVVLNDKDPEVIRQFRSICSERNAPLFPVAEETTLASVDCVPTGSRFSCVTPENQWQDLFLSLPGGFQVENALGVLRVVELLSNRGFQVSSQAIIQGLKNVFWPGRLHKISEKPTIVVDVAHNAQGIQASAKEMKSLFPHDRFICVIGVLGDKQVQKMMTSLFSIVDHFVTVTPENERALPAEQLSQIIEKAGNSVETGGDILAGFERACSLAKPNDLVGVMGSHFIIGKILQKNKKC